MKLTTRCGSAAVDGLNEALLAKAAEAKLLRTNRVRAALFRRLPLERGRLRHFVKARDGPHLCGPD